MGQGDLTEIAKKDQNLFLMMKNVQIWSEDLFYTKLSKSVFAQPMPNIRLTLT